MGTDPKYVIVSRGRVELVIAVTSAMSHADNPGPLGTIPIAAGFFRVSALPDGRLHVDAFGESDSLGLKSREVDAALIRQQLLGID